MVLCMCNFLNYSVLIASFKCLKFSKSLLLFLKVLDVQLHSFDCNLLYKVPDVCNPTADLMCCGTHHCFQRSPNISRLCLHFSLSSKPSERKKQFLRKTQKGQNIISKTTFPFPLQWKIRGLSSFLLTDQFWAREMVNRISYCLECVFFH